MTAQFFDDSETEDCSLDRMMQNVQPNESDVELLIASFGVALGHNVTFG